jgi:FtsH-binding integral membrane protein
MSEQIVVKRNGISFLGLLTILFIGLKLTGYIEWSWFWVLSPMLIPLILVLLIFVLVGLVVSLDGYFNGKK